MGRKSNPLILDYFERGAKIGDASNRYEHTCRRCGEYFPKGRMENLTAHLTKKCTVLTKKERVQIILRINDLVVDDAEIHIFPNPPLSTPNPPIQQNGLEVLAEASRQLGSEGTEQAHPDDTEEQDYLDLDTFDADVDHLDPQLDTAELNNHLSEVHGFPNRPGNGYPATAGVGDLSVHDFIPDMHVPGEAFPEIAVTNSDIPGYHSFTSTGNESMQNIATAHIDNFGVAAPCANLPTTQPGMVLVIGAESNNDEHHTVESYNGPSVFADPDSHSPQFVTETGTNAKTQRPKTRRKFGEERRKEVLAVRKLGACMRCRMLRKVCSPGDTCNTCARIENPRLWKNTCIRKKLLEVFTAYAATPYTVHLHEEQKELKAAHAVNEKSLARVEAFHFVEQKVIFQSRHTKPKRARNGAVVQTPNLPFGEEGILILDIEFQDIQPLMHRYLQAIIPIVIAQEKSPHIRATLQVAHNLSIEQLNDNTPRDPKMVLPRAIELWAATFLLTEHDLNTHFALVADDTGERTDIDKVLNPYVHATMDKQFRAAIEKRAAQLNKFILPVIEARALARDTSRGFETYLVAFVLLNCAERMCWLFNRWERLLPFEWPFEASPATYAATGEEFATTLQLLLSMRSLEPKLTIDHITNVIVPQTAGNSTLEIWLGNAQFPRNFGKQAIDVELNQTDSRCMDGTLSGRLLQL
ncbi:hypothetical protein LTR06_010888 [Exophiala xenobiotica]|nr:hypothetical protein LTR06_010888 [Exophiala xenobiotica]